MPVKCSQKQDHGISNAFDLKILDKVKASIETSLKTNLELSIANTDRTAGKMLPLLLRNMGTRDSLMAQ